MASEADRRREALLLAAQEELHEAAEEKIAAKRIEAFEASHREREIQQQREDRQKLLLSRAEQARIQQKRSEGVRLHDFKITQAIIRNDKVELLSLLDGGANPRTHHGAMHRSPVHVAVIRDRPLLLQMLLHYGASTESHDKFGQTPFTLAVKYRRDRCFEILRGSGIGAAKYVYMRNHVTALHNHRAAQTLRREELRRAAYLAGYGT